MKTTIFFKSICLIFLFAIFSISSIAQENKIIAEIHNLLIDNSSNDKVIQIRFHNCSKIEFETLYKKGLLHSNLVAFRQAYGSEDLIGSIHFLKPTEITTNDVMLLLIQLNIENVLFNEKKMKTSELSKFHFLSNEKISSQGSIEK